MAVSSPAIASQQLHEACKDLEALVFAHQAMEGDQYITAALAIAEQRVRVAAHSYVALMSGQDSQQAPSRVRTQQSSGPVRQDVPIPVPALVAPPQAHAPVQRVTVGEQIRVPTGPGLPDAVIPAGTTLHPRTVERIAQAARAAGQGVPEFAQQVAAEAAQAPPTDLPDIPLMPPPTGAPPPPDLAAFDFPSPRTQPPTR
jgi:hypothetical protein